MQSRMPGNEKAEMALELGRLMTGMRNFLSQLIREEMKAIGLEISFEMLEILACLWNGDGINQQEIADLTVRDKSSITHLIHKLVKRSLVRRAEDEGDKRSKLIYLTPKGRQLRKKLRPRVLDIYDRATGDVRSEDIDRCLTLIRQMTENLESLWKNIVLS